MPSEQLVGRKRELSELRSALDGALRGHGGFYLLTGDSGSGKTRLAREIAAAAQGNAVAAWGRGWEGGGAPLYWPWVQIVRELLEEIGHDETISHLGQRSSLIARIVPELAELTGTPISPRSHAEQDSFELFDAMASFLRTVATTRPLLLIVDDLQWADEASLHLLSFVGRAIRGSAILVLTLYATDLATENDDLIRRATLDATRLEIGGLANDEVAVLYRALRGDVPPTSLVNLLYESTQGNPLFVREALALLDREETLTRPDRSLGFRVPEGLRGVLERRLTGLSAETRRLLGMASVIGRNFDTRTLAALAETEVSDLLPLLTEAVERRIVPEISSVGRYSFSHPLLRELLYEQAPVAHRMRLHRDIAELLERVHRNHLDAHLSELAHHFFKAAQATDKQKAIDYCRRAADAALAVAAFEEAARLYDRALKLSSMLDPSSDLTRRLGEAARAAEAKAARAAEVTSLHGVSNIPTENNSFVKEGEYWSLSFGGRSARLRDSKGLRYLAGLLSRPGQEMHVLDLVNSVSATTAERQVQPEAAREAGLSVDGGDAGPLLDATAKAAYKRRLQDLREDLAEAEENNDLGRAAGLREEMETLSDELSAAVGLGGRDRKAASQAERARMSVGKAIRAALARVDDAHPELGKHLAATVRSGIYCSYTPDPRSPIEWTT